MKMDGITILNQTWWSKMNILNLKDQNENNLNYKN